MHVHVQQAEVAKRRLRKFVRRSAPGLGQPVIDLRDDTGRIGMTLTWESADGVNYQLGELNQPALDRRILDSVIVECRVFFAAQEDCYLPGVVKALQILSPARARALDPLKEQVGKIIRGGALVNPEGEAMMYSGRLEMDNGLGPGRLLGSDQLAMDYIYGIALHEDDERRARIEYATEMESVLFAVLLQMDLLLTVVANVRAQVLHDIDVGHIQIGE